MINTNMIYGKFLDEDGDQYYCPVIAVADNHIVSEWELENCVDAAAIEPCAGSMFRNMKD